MGDGYGFELNGTILLKISIPTTSTKHKSWGQITTDTINVIEKYSLLDKNTYLVCGAAGWKGIKSTT